MLRAVVGCLVVTATAMVPGCDRPGDVDPDGAVIDAAVDGGDAGSPLDAPDVDACRDGNAVDVSMDPTLPAVGRALSCDRTAAPIPGAGDGSMYHCDHTQPLDEADVRSWIVRARGDGTRDIEGELARSFCVAILPLDDHRVVTGRRLTWPPPGGARLVVSDFTAHTSRIVELPAPPGRLLVLDLQAIPGGILASGWTWPDETSMTPHDITWQLDADVAVVRTWLDVPHGVVIPSATPVTLARVEGTDRVALADLDSSAVIEVRTLPMQVERLVAGPQGVIALGRRGCDLAAMPIDSTVATVLPGVSADHASVTLDDRGRVVVAADLGDRHTVALFRLDDARFDGVDGASRIDPTLAPTGHARADIGLPCGPGDACAPGQWHDRGPAYVLPGGPDRLRGCATYLDVAPGGWVVFGETYRTP